MPQVSITSPLILGRYALYDAIATGGMATVHYGRLLGPVGFSRTVAIKRLHAQFARDPEFVSMFLDEARLAARIRHPNVVPTLDVVALEDEVFLVMDYVQGESLSRLARVTRARGDRIPLQTVSAILCGALHGLHAAHEAKNERGEPLGVVHRDVSPQNILVSSDGVPRVLDFGIAKAAGHSHQTREGQLKGKFAYMSPEQLTSAPVDRRTDVYAAGVVLWESLTLERLFTGDSAGAVITNVLNRPVPAPSEVNPEVSASLDAIVLRALARDPGERFASAREMALQLEECVPIASPTRVSAWVEGLAGDVLAERAQSIADIESASVQMAEEPDSSASGVSASRPRPSRISMALGPGEVPSQVSSISVTTPYRSAAVTPQRHWRPVAIGVSAGVVVAAVIGIGVFAHVYRSHAAGAAAASAQSEPAGAPSAVQSELTARPSAQTSGANALAVAPAVPPNPTPAEHAAQAGVARTHSTPMASASPPPARHAIAHATSVKKPHCTIHAYLDATGIEHFAKECR
jgi:eukaryotic-like serine/threonine-protein kinase